MWNEIKDNTDIDNLVKSYGFFHDSCLRDIYISTREFVDHKLAMHFDNKLTATLLFQRQFKPNSVLELRFDNIEQFNFRPFSETEDAVIYDACLIMVDGLFYWADFADWKIGDNDSIWINGQKLFWRFRPELIGNVKRVNAE